MNENSKSITKYIIIISTILLSGFFLGTLWGETPHPFITAPLWSIIKLVLIIIGFVKISTLKKDGWFYLAAYFYYSGVECYYGNLYITAIFCLLAAICVYTETQWAKKLQNI